MVLGGDQEAGRTLGGAPPPSHLQGPHRVAYLLVAIGGGLLGAAPLLPWVHVVLVGDVDLFSLTRIAQHSDALPLIMMLCGGALLLSALVGISPRGIMWFSGATVAATTLFGSGDLLQLLHAIHTSDGFAGAGVGIVVAIAALVLLAIGFVRLARAASGALPPRVAAPRVPPPPPTDVAPGWKPDPWGPATWRYWDGESWTSATAPRRN